VCFKKTRQVAENVTWTKWVTEAAPHFTCNDGDFLAYTIPAMPALKETDARSETVECPSAEVLVSTSASSDIA
jgi:hypothetical protein